MKTSKVIKELQNLVDKKGDKELGIYKSFVKEMSYSMDIDYDKEDDVIYIGIYA